jgi:hypothetical protein
MNQVEADDLLYDRLQFLMRDERNHLLDLFAGGSILECTRVPKIHVEIPKSNLLIETQTVAARLNELNTFMASSSFSNLPRDAKDLHYAQQRVMSKYVQILGKRLEREGKPFEHQQ